MKEQTIVLVKKFITVIFFGLIGQMGCWGLMIGGQEITTLDNALIIHALDAPIIFGFISYIYFKKFNYTSPIFTASIARAPSIGTLSPGRINKVSPIST